MFTIGIDLGGRNIVASVVDDDYNIIGTSKTPTNSPRSADEIFDDIADVCEEAVKTAGLTMEDIDSVGMGTPGTVNQDGVIEFANNLAFNNVPARTMLAKRINKPEEKVFIENGISKIIVYKENIDNIVGYIHSSEMFRSNDEWQNGIRSIPFVPETMAAHKLMRIFKQQKRSLAVVVDEFGGVSGIVALEDLIEEILGDIEDEHDTTSIVAKQISDNEYIFSGRIDIEKANETFGLNLPESENYQTIGGLILNECQSIPKVNDVIQTENFTFKIIKVSANKIELVKLFTTK